MKTSGIPISAFPPKVQEQIRRSIARDGDAFVRLDGPGAPRVVDDPLVPGPGPAMLRQRQGPALNKTEEAWQLELAARFPDRPARVQAVTLLLGNGVRYTPDFFLDPVLPEEDVEADQAYAFEVKGFMRDDAAVKLKVAASLHRWIRFFLVSRKGRAQPWRVQEVLA